VKGDSLRWTVDDLLDRAEVAGGRKKNWLCRPEGRGTMEETFNGVGIRGASNSPLDGPSGGGRVGAEGVERDHDGGAKQSRRRDNGAFCIRGNGSGVGIGRGEGGG